MDPPQHSGFPNYGTDWDKTTFRISRIPEDYDLRCLSDAVKTVFELESSSHFKIHSLASDASDENDDPCRVSTISFHTRPTRLLPAVDDLEEWEVDLPSTVTSQRAYARVLFDTHFKSFYPINHQ